MDMSFIEQLMLATTRIESIDVDGNAFASTGFFYCANVVSGRGVPLLITNKHAVDNAAQSSIVLTILPASGQKQYQQFVLQQYSASWIDHPDPHVDLCALPIGPLINEIVNEGSWVHIEPLSKNIIPSKADIDEMIGLESIVLIGYPDGIWDTVNNLPILRRGILASHYSVDWNGQPEFVVDASCFPGSSGSPVMLIDSGTYRTRTGVTMSSAPRIKLLGILYGGYEYQARGELAMPSVAKMSSAKFSTYVPNNLGIAIKAHRLLDFEPIIAARVQN